MLSTPLKIFITKYLRTPVEEVSVCVYVFWVCKPVAYTIVIANCTLSEEIAHPTVYHHLSQLSVNVQLNGLIKCMEDSVVQMQLNQVIFSSLSWILPD